MNELQNKKISICGRQVRSGFMQIYGYDNYYCVNADGVVVAPSYYDKAGRLRKERILSPVKRGKGYLCVGLLKNGKQIRVSIHRLVAESFIPNPNNLPQVNHINGIKTDNRAENLEWVTCSENAIHAFENNLRKAPNLRGENNNSAKLTRNEVLEIRKSGLCVTELAEKYNVTKSAIYKIKEGKRWGNEFKTEILSIPEAHAL